MLESFRTRFGGSPKERRREPREEIKDGTVEIKGQTFRLHDWSIRAFMAKPCVVDCKPTDRIDIKFSARFPEGPIEFACRAIVVRVDREREEMAAYFAMLDEAAQAAIENHFADDSAKTAGTRPSPKTAPPGPAPAAARQPDAPPAEKRATVEAASRTEATPTVADARAAEVTPPAQETSAAEAKPPAQGAQATEPTPLAQEVSAAEPTPPDRETSAAEATPLAREPRATETARATEGSSRAGTPRGADADATVSKPQRSTAADSGAGQVADGGAADQTADAEPDGADAPAAETARGPAPATPQSQLMVSMPSARVLDSPSVGVSPASQRVDEIKRRAAAVAAEMAETKEHLRAAVFELGMRNLAAFREKVDAAGITKILHETPRIKVLDHDHAYAFHFRGMEYAVFVDWENGVLCRDVRLEGGTRRTRIVGLDHDAALDEMAECLARMLATIEAGDPL